MKDLRFHLMKVLWVIIGDTWFSTYIQIDIDFNFFLFLKVFFKFLKKITHCVVLFEEIEVFIFTRRPSK